MATRATVGVPLIGGVHLADVTSQSFRRSGREAVHRWLTEATAPVISRRVCRHLAELRQKPPRAHLLADLVIPRPAAAGALSSAKLPGDDVIDELRVARPESGPALALDNEDGEGTGRELLFEPRQLSTP